LHLARQPGRIKHDDDVVLEESAAVAGLTSLTAQEVLQRSERADPSGQFDPTPPRQRGQVRVEDPAAQPDQKAAEDHEQREREVDDDEGVGQQ